MPMLLRGKPSPRREMLVGLVVAAMVALGATETAATPAKEAPHEGMPPDAVAGRVSFAPRLGADLTHGPGRLCVCTAGADGRPLDCACDPPDPAREALMPLEGLTVQNLGDRPTRFLVSAFRPGFADGSCEDCGHARTVCSPDVAPGMTWTFSPYIGWSGDTPRPGATSAVVYALDPGRAADAGPDWESWLRAEGLDPDTRLADLACRYVAGGTYDDPPVPVLPGPVQCASYAAFHAAFVAADGRLPGTDLPIGPLRGQAMAAVVAAVTTAGSADRLVVDRYEAVDWREAAAPSDTGVRTYVAPGGSGRTADGSNSVLSVQNAGPNCLLARAQPHRARFGAFGEPVQLTLPPGRRVEIDVGATWPALQQGAALVVTADGPLAATLTNLGVATSASAIARRARAIPVRWLVPRAYQEERRLPTLSASGRLDDLTSADGWQTNLAIFNPEPDRAMATLRFQATLQPPRPLLDYPVEPESQVVLQPGFGLGRDGGPGWVEVTSSDASMTVSAEGLRSARGVPGLVIEAWAASAVPLDPGSSARVIGLPSLGGPAVGQLLPGSVVSPTRRLTDSLVTRISLQNPLTTTSRVAVDSYGEGCGYVDTVERQIDPRQTVVLDAGELVGTAFGADAAIVRIVEGDVAVLVETSRARWLTAAPNVVPPDFTTAYVGVPADGPVGAPTAPAAEIAARPTRVDVEVDGAAVEAHVLLEDVATSGRCLSVRAESDASWLRVPVTRARVPGELRFWIEAGAAQGGGSRTGSITLVAEQPNVEGSPATIEVVVTRAAPPALYLPAAVKGAAGR